MALPPASRLGLRVVYRHSDNWAVCQTPAGTDAGPPAFKLSVASAKLTSSTVIVNATDLKGWVVGFY